MKLTHSKPRKDGLSRRDFGKKLALSVAAASTFMLAPFKSFAAWSSSAFQAIPYELAIERYFGPSKIEKSSKIMIKMAKIAQNGAQVPITVSTSLHNAQSITLIAKDNPIPLIATFSLFPDTMPTFTTRIRLAKSTEVFAIVKANDQLFKAQKKVEVTIGGCGG